MTARQPITRYASGKLFITGEYAVMEPGTPAVLVAVDRRVGATVSGGDAHGVEISADLCPKPAHLDWQGCRLVGRAPVDERIARDQLAHAVAALEAVAELLAQRGSAMPVLDLSISSELHDNGTKLGLGSSGAVTVAVIAASTAYCDVELTPEDLFRLAMIASARVNPDSSGADLAASIWGGWIVYRAPDRAAVLGLVQRCGLTEALTATWPGFAIHRLAVPDELTLEVGWTGRPASTPELVRGRGSRAWRDTGVHRAFVAEMTDCVLATVDALERGDRHSVLAQISSARELLAGLDDAADLGIFTDGLIALCDAADTAGWAAKPSGAGGGDCGIALFDTADEADTARLRARWAAAGIQHLPIRVIGDEVDA